MLSLFIVITEVECILKGNNDIFKFSLLSVFGLGIWCLTPLLTIFQLYIVCQFYCWRKHEYLEITTDLS